MIVAAPRRVVLFGLFGFGNLGNEATLWVTLYHLRRRMPDAEIACVCDSLPEFAKDFGVVGLPFDPLPVRGARLFPSRLLKLAYVILATLLTEPIRRRKASRLLADAEQFVVVGTGVLDDLGELPWGMPSQILRWVNAARSSRATVHLLAVGAGPMSGDVNRLLMTRAVARADIRSYRDDYSRDYMRRLGVSSDADKIVPDLAFALPEEWLPTMLPANDPPKVIGIGVIAYFGWNVDRARGREMYAAYIANLAEFVNRLIDAGYLIRLLIGERRTDTQTIRDLLGAIGPAKLSKAGDRIVASELDSVQDVLNEIAQTDIVVASRFHNLVFALLLGRPVVSLGYSAKFEALMKEMKMNHYCQSVENLDVDRLFEQLHDLATNHAAAVTSISARVVEYRQQLEHLYDSTFVGGQRQR
jgi:polysaccharide pyruvyl transferase WcaK-like protein